MSGRIVIFGYGPVGRAIAARLLAEGREVLVAQRKKPPGLPNGLTFTPSDALDRESVVKSARGADQIVVAIGLPYSSAVWREGWPRAIENFVAAAEASGARVVFIDDLYMYGPQTTPLSETMALTHDGIKPAARAVATRVWMVADAAGRARVAALRAPDFYGPGVGQSWLGDATIGALARGKAAAFIGSPDMPHDYAYLPDVARAATTLLGAPDSAFGQSWHVPCAPTRTTREILAIAADALGVKLRINAMPEWLLRPAGLFSPFLRELREMRFQWDRPYRVDSSKFAKTFWSDATPFETGVRETALAFRAALRARRRGGKPGRRRRWPCPRQFCPRLNLFNEMRVKSVPAELPSRWRARRWLRVPYPRSLPRPGVRKARDERRPAPGRVWAILRVDAVATCGYPTRMKTVSIRDAKNRLTQLAREVERGETIIVTRNGSPAFELAPHRPRKGLRPEAIDEFKRKHGIKTIAPFVAEDFDDPLPEDFLLRPMPREA